MDSKVATILVNYNNYADTIECINSLQKQTLKSSLIIIIDNKSTNLSTIELSKKFNLNAAEPFQELRIYKSGNRQSQIFLIENSYNAGFACANNLGISFAQTFQEISYIWLLNNDTVVAKHAIYELIKFSSANKKNKKIAISPKVVSYYENIIDSTGFAHLNLITSQSNHHLKYIFNFSYLVGSSIFLTSIKDVPYFDENFFLYYEDADYTLKLKKLGYDLEYLPKEIVFHKISNSTKLNPRIERIKIQSMTYFFKKNFILYMPILIITRTFYYILKGRFCDLNFFYKSILSL